MFALPPRPLEKKWKDVALRAGGAPLAPLPLAPGGTPCHVPWTEGERILVHHVLSSHVCSGNCAVGPQAAEMKKKIDRTAMR